MLPQHIYQSQYSSLQQHNQQQHQQLLLLLLAYHNSNSNSRKSSTALPSMMNMEHHHHHHHQQQQQGYQHHIHPPPQTPFDMAYGASMLPRQLLVGSPFIQTPINGSPSRAHSRVNVVDNSYFPNVISGSPSPMNLPDRRRTGYMSRPPVMRSLSVSSSSTSLNDFYHTTKNLSHSRSVIIQGLPSQTNLTQFLDNVKIGPIENCYFLENDDNNNDADTNDDVEHNDKSIVLCFLENIQARTFYNQVTTNHKLAIALNAPDLKIKWNFSNDVLNFVKNAITNDSATRNVYIGNLPNSVTKQILEDEMINYGNIDTIDFIQDRKIAFVHFTNIASAIKAVEQLPLESDWSRCKVFYGKDRCSQQPVNAASSSSKVNDNTLRQLSDLGLTNNELLNSTLTQNTKLANTLLSSGGSNNVGNRCVYLGNLHPQTTVEEICNVIRGGLLQSIRLIIERHICFLTFIDPLAAVQFFASTNMDGLIIHGRRLKIGWGKHSGSLPNSIALLVTAGLSRNLYIGVVNEDNVVDKIPNEAVLRQDFKEYGDIEQINFFKDGLCAFVNFLNITSAMKCVDEFHKNEFESKFNGRYKNFKISFGKDRCGNPPKLKKQKKSNKQKLGHEKPIYNNTDEDEKNKSSDALIFASMGITSKSLNVAYTAEEERKKLESSESLPTTKEEDEDDDEEEEEVTTPIKENHMLEQDKTPEIGKNEVLGKLQEEDEEDEEEVVLLSPTTSIPLDYDTSDSDSVSIVIGNDNINENGDISPTTSKPSENNTATSSSTTTALTSINGPRNLSSKKNFNQKINTATPFRYNKNNSRSSSFSCENGNLPKYLGFNSRQSSKSQLNKYYQQQQQQQFAMIPPPAPLQQNQLNAFATSGSQVMAQYLAQSQHENLLYATHVLTEEDQQGYNPYHHQPHHPHHPHHMLYAPMHPLHYQRRNEVSSDVEEEEREDGREQNEEDDLDYDDDDEEEDDDEEGTANAANAHYYYDDYPRFYPYPVQQVPYFLATPTASPGGAAGAAAATPIPATLYMPSTPIMMASSSSSGGGITRNGSNGGLMVMNGGYPSNGRHYNRGSYSNKKKASKKVYTMD